MYGVRCVMLCVVVACSAHLKEHTRTCTRTHARASKHARTDARTHERTHAHAHARTHTHARTHPSTRARMHTHTKHTHAPYPPIHTNYHHQQLYHNIHNRPSCPSLAHILLCLPSPPLPHTSWLLLHVQELLRARQALDDRVPAARPNQFQHVGAGLGGAGACCRRRGGGTP